MFGIGFANWDLLLIRFRKNHKEDFSIGYIRYYLREELEPTKFKKREDAEKVLEIIKNSEINFVNDSVENSIVNGTNIDKSKLKIFEIKEDK